MEALHNLLINPCFIGCVMAIIIFLVTQFLKLPIKHFTKKIKNERKRKIINATILLIPFALGILFDFVYSTYVLNTIFTGVTGLGYGAAGISLYGVVERFFKVKIDNPYDSEEGQAVKDLVSEVVADGKVDEEDISAVQKFLDKVSK